MGTPFMTVYVTIGNSDNKLSQEEWADYQRITRDLCFAHADETHGTWYSEPTSKYQNMILCIRTNVFTYIKLLDRLREVREEFNQDSIAIAALTGEVAMI